MGTTPRARSGAGRSDPLSYASVPVAPGSLTSDPAWSKARKIAFWLLAGYVASMLAVFLLLRTSLLVASGNETSGDRAVFTAVNAGTLTGFQQTMGLREMRQVGIYGPAVILVLTLIGSLVSLTVGGLAASRILAMPHTIRQIVSAAVTSVLLASLAGAAALAVTGMNVFDAVLQAASAFGNSGLHTGTLPTTLSPATYLVLLPLAVLGGLGLPVLIELGDRVFGGPSLSGNSRVVLRMTGIVYLLGFAALLLAQAPVASGAGWPAWRSTLASCSVAAVNTRTAGFAFQSPAAFTAAGQWILMALMLIGAASAGTAGGIKVNTLWQLGKGIRQVLAGRAVQRAVGIAAVWAGVYGAALFTGLLFLLTIEPQIPGDRLLFLAVSAIGNVGLSHDPVAITGPGLFVLSLLMLVGRLSPLGVLWWIAETTPGTDVLVG
jgi:trk system potassium uptake protein TrkH